MHKCYIEFSKNKKIKVNSYGEKKNFYGNITFNNSNLGYQEILTDPSYYNDIILFNTPYIGNIGVNKKDNESHRIWAAGLIVNKITNLYSFFKARKGLKYFLKKNKIIVITTNKIRKIMREIKKCGKIKIYFKKKKKKKIIKEKEILEDPFVNFTKGFPQKKSIIYNYGIKKNIIRCLNKEKIFTLCINENIKTKKIKKDGYVFSNGPGNPKKNIISIKKAKKIIKKNIPILGICLGHQIISLSLKKKLFRKGIGQHGPNYPVKINKKYIITTQNHNYYVENDTEIKEINNNTNQGMIYKNIITFQGHPESCPGTTEAQYIFKKYKKLL